MEGLFGGIMLSTNMTLGNFLPSMFCVVNEQPNQNVHFLNGPLNHVIRPFENPTKTSPKSQIFRWLLFSAEPVF